MTQVIYADVLVVLNIYVTYILLLLTGKITREKTSGIRLALSSFLGGMSSLLLLIPGMSEVGLSALRLPLAVMLLITAFKKSRLRTFLRLIAAYFAVSFIFAGLMLALWYFVSPSLYFSSGIVYFSVDSLTLILMTVVCYGAVRVIAFFIGSRYPSARIYTVKITVLDRSITCRAFLDTGNSLCDPFTGYPAIIVTFGKIKELIPEVKSITDIAEIADLRPRFLPCSTVTGQDVLMCFRPEKVSVSGVSIAFSTQEAVVAVTQNELKGGEYDALIPQSIFKNKTDERGEDYADAV